MVIAHLRKAAWEVSSGRKSASFPGIAAPGVCMRRRAAVIIASHPSVRRSCCGTPAPKNIVVARGAGRILSIWSPPRPRSWGRPRRSPSGGSFRLAGSGYGRANGRRLRRRRGFADGSAPSAARREDAWPSPLVAAVMDGGGRAGGISDCLVGAVETQQLKEPVEHDPVADPRAVATQRMRRIVDRPPGQQRREPFPHRLSQP